MNSWIDDALTQLSEASTCGYQVGAPTASEPAAMAALALLAHGRTNEARVWLEWLVKHQASDGSVGISAAEPEPGWPTSLAILAWHSADKSASPAGAPPATTFLKSLGLATRWLVHVSGDPVARVPGMGHDSSLIGWSWVLGTHSWVEPTAWGVAALKATGHRDHPRTREAVRLLIDRLFPQGGCNYGNTKVLGQELRPHVQPTGVTLLALVGEHDPAGRIAASCDYLANALHEDTPSASLAYGVLGLAAHDRRPAQADAWLAAAAARLAVRGKDPLRTALLLLAIAGKPPLTSLAQSEGLSS